MLKKNSLSISMNFLGPVYMEASYPGKRAGSVAEMNYFLRLYGICLLESLENQLRISFCARAFQHFSSR